MIKKEEIENLKDLTIRGSEREVLQIIAQLLFELLEVIKAKK